MPEHREGTPPTLADLESFLWWDFDPETWRAWAKTRRFGVQATTDDFADAAAVQAALRRLEHANNGGLPDAGAVERVNQALARYGIAPRVSPDSGVGFIQGDARQPVGTVLRLFVEAMSAGAWSRFKLCRDEGCRASYFDASKNNSKTWCSMDTCGSRNKMRRLRARRP